MKYYKTGITSDNEADRDFNETIFFTGNGYMGARGYLGEEISAKKNEKGFMIAGVFDKMKGNLTDVVTCSDLFRFELEVNGELIHPFGQNISGLIQQLEYETGVMSYEYQVRCSFGTLEIKVQRFFSYANVHDTVMQIEVMPIDFTAEICVRDILDGNCKNRPIHDDQVKANDEIVSYVITKDTEIQADILYLENQTRQTGIVIASAARLRIMDGAEILGIETEQAEGMVARKSFLKVTQGKSCRFIKYGCVYTSRECEPYLLKKNCLGSLEALSKKDFHENLDQSSKILKEIWKDCDIILEGDERVWSALRYTVYQLICNQSRDDQTVSIGARGLTHTRYKGCYFWDTDIFLLPFYLYTQPESAKKLVEYRYGTLEAARKHARKMNHEGARFPWMASYDGSEQCESWDIGACEIHVTADVVYGIDRYIEVSGDEKFLYEKACELYLETARFWAGRFTYEKGSDRYNLLFVKGPDEYCGATTNNTYTNVMALYNLSLAIKTIEKMKAKCPEVFGKLAAKIGFQEEEQDLWNDILKKVPLCYDSGRRLYLQDDTFEKLEEVDVRAFKDGEKAAYHKVCFDRLQRYKVIKQADIVLMMTLFPNDFTEEEKQAAYDYYEPLTLHDSSLSYGVHAQLAAVLGREQEALGYFEKSLFLDLEDIMHNTGTEGIHIAALGTSWQALMFGFAGVTVTNGALEVKPHLPSQWKKLSFSVTVEEKKYKIVIDHDGVFIT